jgi:hypothetical protein
MYKAIITGIIVSVLAAAALAGFNATTEAAKAVTKCESVESQVKEILIDVREIKMFLMENK